MSTGGVPVKRNAMDPPKIDDAMTSEPERPSVRGLVRRWASDTACHGVPSILRSGHPLRKIFWILVVLAGTGMTTWQIVVLIEDFFSYPINISFNISMASSVPFPAVTFCNVNRLRKSMLPMTGGIFEDILSYTYSDGTSAPPATEQTLQEIREQFDRVWGQMNISLQGEVGHQLANGMLISCTFSGVSCNASSFVRVLNPHYGNCYAFNFNDQPTLQSHLPGPEHGLTLELFTEMREYIPEVTENAGIRITVHDPDIMSFPEDDGALVSPYQMTMIGIQKEEVTRLPYPYASQCWNLSRSQSIHNNVYSEELDVLYSLKGCQRTCYQERMIENCSCATSTVPSNGTAFTQARASITGPLRICGELDEPCSDVITAEYVNGTLTCNCSMPCSDVYFPFTISANVWPNQPYKHIYYSRLMHVNSELTTLVRDWYSGNGTDPAEQLIKLQVFYEDLGNDQITEQEGETVYKLMSNFGGTIGLYLGLSLAATFEFIELLIDLIRVGFQKCLSSSKNKNGHD